MPRCSLVRLMMPTVLMLAACGDADPACLEVASICHDEAVLNNNPDAQDCYDLRNDKSMSAEECESKRTDCEAICSTADTGAQ